MTFVTPLKPCKRRRKWPHDQVAYLYANSVTELHRMAKQLHVGKTHYRDHPTRPRYNLSPATHVKAIAAGASTKAFTETCSP